MKNRPCKQCEEPFAGRADKKFCSDACRSTFHYYNALEKEEPLFKFIVRQLKTNRSILYEFNRAGKATVRKQVLIDEGFYPKFFTHHWKAKNGNVYQFCYEYGFMKKSENNKEKYVLIQWQKYMV